MFRKVGFLLLALVLLTSFVSCSGKGDRTSTSDTTQKEDPSHTQEVIDITGDLEWLGINAYSKWNNSDPKYIISRNPYDMIIVGDKVLVSGGNYEQNTGPVPIYSYSSGTAEALLTGNLDTEQVDRFYDCGDYIVALAIDPKDWQFGGLYFYSKAENKWITKSKVLVNNIHCYDMAEHNGSYFLCGSNVFYGDYKRFDGRRLELPKAVIYKIDGQISPDLNAGNYKEVEVIDKYGRVIDYETTIKKHSIPTGDFYSTTGVPRFHDLFEFNGELYAFYFNQYYTLYEEEYNMNGFYRYDDEKNQFIYDDSLCSDEILKLYMGTSQDGEKIQHDFEFGGRIYFINDGMISSGDFKTYREEKISGYENYVIRDVIFRDDKAYILAGEEQDDGTYINAVFETSDFNNYSILFKFEDVLFARSFELCDGYFYFGLGTWNKREYTSKDEVIVLPEYAGECGTIYRYKYFG